MAELAQMLGIPVEDLDRLTVREVGRLAVEWREAVFSIALSDPNVTRKVQEQLAPSLEELRRRK